MKLLIAIEEKINALLIKLFEYLAIVLNRFFHKIIPQKVFTKLDNFKNILHFKKIKINEKKLLLKEKLNLRLIELKSQKAKLLNIKATLVIFLSSWVEEARRAKNGEKKAKGEPHKYILQLKMLREKIYNYVIHAKPAIVIASLVSVCITGLSVIIILKNTNQILTKKGIKLGPASVDVYIKPRPSYYQAGKRYMVMMYIYIPVYPSGSNKYQTLSVDVQVVTSIRYTKEFLTKNQTLVRDQFSMTMEPIIPEFPLTVEGRTILKGKIKQEIENVLKKFNVPGHIEEVVIVNIFTT